MHQRIEKAFLIHDVGEACRCAAGKLVLAVGVVGERVICPVRVAAAWHERQVTTRPQNHLLTNVNVWSPDGRWIVYDTRSDAEGAVFDGRCIERVNVETGESHRKLPLGH